MNDDHQTSLALSAKVSAQTRERLAMVVAMVAGYVDAYGYISYRTYLSFMSGNTTQSGLLIGKINFPGAAPTLLAILSFVVGVFAGTLLIISEAPQSHRCTFGLVAGLLSINIGFTELGVTCNLISIAILSFAMGVLNTTLSRIGAEKINVTFVTGTLNKIGSHLALALRRVPLKDAQGLWDTHIRRTFLLVALWIAFLIGAVLAVVTTARFGAWVLLLPFLILLVLAVFSREQIESS